MQHCFLAGPADSAFVCQVLSGTSVAGVLSLSRESLVSRRISFVHSLFVSILSNVHVYFAAIITYSQLSPVFSVTSNRETCDATLWTPNLEYYSGYKFIELKPVLKTLAKAILSAKTSKFQVTFSVSLFESTLIVGH